MRSLSLLAVLAALLLSACGRATASPADPRIERLEAENRALRERLDPLPPALDRLYPPAAPKPVYLLAMVDMANLLDAVAADTLEGDPEGARGSFARFETSWYAAADLVPEWRTRFPDAPLAALGAAVKDGQPGAVMGAVTALGESCMACHVQTMVAAQQRYRWGDFLKIQVDDPATGGKAPFPAVMHALATHLAGIGADVQQGQPEAARRHLEGLRGAYETLEGTCGTCHATGRAYYVGDAAKTHLDDLGKELAKERPDPEAVGRAAASLGETSCMRCHLVHVPAALSRLAR